MRRHIRLNFVDFWSDFEPTNTYLYKILKTKYTLEITDKPDFLIYSAFGQEHKKYKCIRIFYTGENVRPDFSECDYAFSFDYLDNRNHYRLPLYAVYFYPPEKLVKKDIDVEQILRSKTKFCNFVYSKSIIKRNNFFHKLSRYKRVDSGGRLMNNIGGPLGDKVGDKLAFIKDYKFTIAFENSVFPGYTTEKLVHPMQVHSLAIYWGNELVHRDFNPKSFLNYHDFEDEDELIQRIIEVDQNDELYMEYLRQPYFHNNTVNEYINPENILKQFAYIFDNVKKPVALKSTLTNIRIGRGFRESQYAVNPGLPRLK
ncbi:Alpha-(1,3)-fucosyltransferase FucT [subsurface metagenome]